MPISRGGVLYQGVGQRRPLAAGNLCCMDRRAALDEAEQVVLLNAVEEGLLAELHYEVGTAVSARDAFERLWRQGLVSLYVIEGEELSTTEVAAVSPALRCGTARMRTRSRLRLSQPMPGSRCSPARLRPN
jgi:hypothetical protein